MKIPNEIKKKLLEELISMMDEMDSEGLPKKGSAMLISMEGNDDEDSTIDENEEDEDIGEEDMQGMDPRLMELIKKKKGMMHGMKMGG